MLKLAKNIKQHQYKSAAFLKAELASRGVSYETLSNRLQSIGVKRSPEAIRQGLHRGSLSMAFFFQCMEVLSIQEPTLVSSLKYHLKRKGLTYNDLSERLNKVGVQKSPLAIATMLSRGRLSSAFLDRCAQVLNIDKGQLNHCLIDF